MFKGIKDKFKYKSGVKFLKQEMKTPLEPANRSHGITSIGIIVDLDKFERAESFYELQDEYKLRPNAVKIIGYRSYYDKNSPYATPIFSDKDLGWNGQIENSYALEFLGREYDLLINYYKEDNLLMKIMSVKANARFRVGFTELDSFFNDLIVNIPLNDFQTFKKELKKYLGVLDEIKK